MSSNGRKYSCETASQTLEWINAIVDFIRPYTFLTNAHVVNFFKDRLWEAVDEEWMDCLRKEAVENLLQIPCGVVQDHWPASLKNFIVTLSSLVLPRQQADLQTVLPGMDMTSLNSVLSTGMNAKKKHEVEVLSAVVNSIASSVRANAIIDVGSGQGYLAQVLSFHYQHAVFAIDACSHHGRVTDARAEQIKKYYASQIRKSVTFMECKEVKAVVSVGCCYNLLSEEGSNHVGSQCGFPMSHGVKSAGLSLGKSSRDLACQSAERWRCLENDAGVHNFELHAFRAAFQMVLSVYYPKVMTTSPSIGRQGKALRRRQQRVAPDSSLHHKESTCSSLSQINSAMKGSWSHIKPTVQEADGSFDTVLETTTITNENSFKATQCGRSKFIGKYPLFQKYCLSGLSRLGLEPLKEMDVHGIWKEVESSAELIGPYWSLRAAFGPLLETFLLLDRLLFLQEQGSSIEAEMQPIFNPALSPRNVAIIAKKLTTQM
ncbi:uncharacterized protein LOC126621841 isoform X2 [Malus sylvestris]|uniref:uncharacterized protein LOC126621841 isoform X2 n=1 Tax=Malus sylvestris TaxID=3752 RepID=UPI0021AC50E4|nr:uncharacterized protein LOC126621841 isoform X2 [Malus sylvestris]